MRESVSLVERAASFAKAAHESVGQRRKYTGEPYIVHPQSVASIVASVTDDENMICAAWLHDVVEDTPISLEEIRAEFGDDIANLVDGLTDVSKPEDGNRASRLEIDRNHTAATCPRTKSIKLADLIDNLTDIVDQASGFARRYIPEKEALLAVLREGDSRLISRVEEIIRTEKTKLDSKKSS